MKPLVAKTLATARKYIGTRELPGNRGPLIKKWLALCGIDDPAAWCMAFICAMIVEAAGTRNVTKYWVVSASCDVILFWARKQGILFDEPEIGDVGLVMKRANDSNHTFFVTKVTARSIATIEGNTNDDGGREGHSVLARRRSRSGKYKYVRWSLLLPDAPAAVAIEESGFSLFLNDKKLADVPVVEGKTLVSVRTLAKALGFSARSLAWDAATKGVRLDGDLLPVTVTLRGSAAYAPVRELAKYFGLVVAVEGKKITLSRAKG